MEILELIKGKARIDEAYRVTTFKGWGPNGNEVTIELKDAGPDKANMRYSVAVRDEQGHETIGNPDASIEMAIDRVHWDELTRWAP